jgi:hypothetical protein
MQVSLRCCAADERTGAAAPSPLHSPAVARRSAISRVGGNLIILGIADLLEIANARIA